MLAWRAFDRAAAAVDGYAALVADSAIYRDIDVAVAQYRGHVREYAFSDDEDVVASATKDSETLRGLIASGLTRVTNPERHRLLEDMAKQAEAYTAAFARLHAMNLEQGKLQREVLDAVGVTMTERFTIVAAEAVNAGAPTTAALAVEGRRQVLLARLGVNERLSKRNEKAAQSAEQQFSSLGGVLAQLDAATRENSGLNASVKDVARQVET